MEKIKEQIKAVETIVSSQDKIYLLEGVTGSGKPSIFYHLIDRVLKMGKTALMLVPEISLTPQMVNKFKSIFGENIAVLVF